MERIFSAHTERRYCVKTFLIDWLLEKERSHSIYLEERAKRGSRKKINDAISKIKYRDP